MSNIQVFNFHNDPKRPVRVVVENGKEFFLVKNVCNILGLSNASVALSRLEVGGISKIYTPTSSGNQLMSYIDEAGLYELIFASNKPEAKEFKKWVFTDVLPKLRNVGQYTITQAPQIDSKFLLQIAEEMQKKELLIEKQQNTIQQHENTFNDIANIQDSYSLREAAKNLIIGERQLQEYLKQKKWWIYLSNGDQSKKMYSTSYAKERKFAIDKAVLNKINQKFYHQFRITKIGMDFLIKNREVILQNI